ncbi:hypothetical protein [Jeongeupia sp. USM3]|nr:hypothetical protein [Jeongeupia sp. USM3]
MIQIKRELLASAGHLVPARPAGVPAPAGRDASAPERIIYRAIGG